MDNLWKRDFKNIDDGGKTPKEIIQYQCEALAELTEGKVIARISACDRDLRAFNLPSAKVPKPYFKSDFNAGEILGEAGNEESLAYEFYLSSPKTPQYKFKAFLIYHSIMLYPVTFIIENGIANELISETLVRVDNEGEFVKCLERILNTERISRIIDSLLILNRD